MRPEALYLSVSVAGDRLVGPRLLAARQPSPTAALRGRPVADALSLVPLLFSLCGTAQQVAALRAVEAAQGVTVSASQDAARRLLIAAETLAELSLGVLRDWADLLDQPPRLEDARRLRVALGSLRAALGPGPWHLPGGAPLRIHRPALARAVAEARAQVVRAIFGGAEPAAPSDWTDLGPGPAQDMLRHLYVHGLEGFGATSLPFLDDAVDDGPAETGPLARRRDEPTVAAILGQHGAGLFARKAARLADIAGALRELEESAARVCNDIPGEGGAPGTGRGTGRVEAARGALIHTLSVDDGRIGDWTILAPTDWNFHPQGPLVRGLEGAPAGTDPERRTRLLVASLDPCVACKVEVRNDA